MANSRIDPSSPRWYLQNPLWQSSTLFAEAHTAIDRLRNQFANAGVSLNPTSELAGAMERAARFARAPAVESGNDDLFMRALIQGQYLDRVARACEGIRGMRDERQHLLQLKKGALDPGSRTPSPAKDKLFELELFSLLQERQLETTLSEPDITAGTPFGVASIACKRIYSRSNAQSQISRGVRQLNNSQGHKILALCLDDLFPPYSGISAESPKEASMHLVNLASEFLSVHQARIFNYFAKQRLLFLVASITSPVCYIKEQEHLAAQTQLFFFMPDPALGEFSVVARQICDALFFRPSDRWNTDLEDASS